MVYAPERGEYIRFGSGEMSSLKEKKISKRDMVMRAILAAIIVGLLSAWGYSMYEDYQDSQSKGIGDMIPELYR